MFDTAKLSPVASRILKELEEGSCVHRGDEPGEYMTVNELADRVRFPIDLFRAIKQELWENGIYLMYKNGQGHYITTDNGELVLNAKHMDSMAQGYTRRARTIFSHIKDRDSARTWLRNRYQEDSLDEMEGRYEAK